MKLTVNRNRDTIDGIFGKLTIDTDPFFCYTCENLEKSIPAGEYPLIFSYSRRFQRMMPEILVPKRTGIRIHSANYPNQLEGCIAVGNREEEDAVDDSKNTFVKLMIIIKDEDNLSILIT